jgi:hypothetical protein
MSRCRHPAGPAAYKCRVTCWAEARSRSYRCRHRYAITYMA